MAVTDAAAVQSRQPAHRITPRHRPGYVGVDDTAVVGADEAPGGNAPGNGDIGQAEIAQGAAEGKQVDEAQIAAGSPVVGEVIQHMPAAIQGRGRKLRDIPPRESAQIEIGGQAEFVIGAVGKAQEVLQPLGAAELIVAGGILSEIIGDVQRQAVVDPAPVLGAVQAAEGELVRAVHGHGVDAVVRVDEAAAVQSHQSADVARPGYRSGDVAVADAAVVGPHQPAGHPPAGNADVGQADVHQAAAGGQGADEPEARACCREVDAQVVEQMTAAIERRRRKLRDIPPRQGGQIEVGGQSELVACAVDEAEQVLQPLGAADPVVAAAVRRIVIGDIERQPLVEPGLVLAAVQPAQVRLLDAVDGDRIDVVVRVDDGAGIAPHQPAEVAQAGHRASRVAVTDAAVVCSHQPADRGAVATHPAGRVAVADDTLTVTHKATGTERVAAGYRAGRVAAVDRAVTVTRQTADIVTPGYRPRCMAVGDDAIAIGAHQPADLVGPDHRSGGIAPADRPLVIPHQPADQRAVGNHVDRGMAVVDGAVAVCSRQSTDGIAPDPGHGPGNVAVADGTVVIPHQPADVTAATGDADVDEPQIPDAGSLIGLCEQAGRIG